MDFSFRLGSLDLEGPDELSTDPVERATSPPPDPDTPIAVRRLSAASGMSTAMFSSPMSSASQVTGRVKSNVEVGLFYSEAVEYYCCGAIQGGSVNRAFCKAVNKCTSQIHKEKKAVIRNGYLHIRGVKANQIFVEPIFGCVSIVESQAQRLDQRQTTE
jgi:hypothetical protein